VWCQGLGKGHSSEMQGKSLWHSLFLASMIPVGRLLRIDLETEKPYGFQSSNCNSRNRAIKYV